MKEIFKIGAKKTFSTVVKEKDAAAFDAGMVHPVYSTFSLCRDAEWVCRLFVLDMKEEDEEGIGTMVSIEHHSAALIGQQVDFIAEIESINGHEIICTFQAKVGERLIAEGKTGQRILKRDKIERIFSNLH